MQHTAVLVPAGDRELQAIKLNYKLMKNELQK